MTIKHIPVKELTDSQVRTLQKLTMGPNKGLMYNRLSWCVSNPLGCHVYYVTRFRKIIGWALIFHKGSYKRGLYMFVHPNYRRQGVGKALSRYVAKHQAKNQIFVYPWDPTSGAFYSTLSDLPFKNGRGY